MAMHRDEVNATRRANGREARARSQDYMRRYLADYYAAHKADLRRRAREYYNANSEKIRAQAAQYLSHNREKVLAAMKKRRQEHP